MSSEAQTFTTTLEATGGNNVGIVVPDEVLEALGRGKRVPVRATVDGHTWTTTTGSRGGRVLVSFNAATRAATGRGAGDEVEVHLAVDDEPRTVEVPEALAAALDARPGAREAFDALSPSKRKAHAQAVASAKTEATSERRIAAVLDSLG
ncbi:YdeI/OmpD-associated family protein [uncultured Nocardioides sp.]|uniref:YdeI/OmpD-associated family protein n=1 Tax=uncultured Nocardioides sp. TaxID=198441 RepID=UPI00260A701A|nr:YdeI/OmpD-associated family protein [uncultured Nocardioides sp.]